MESQKVNKYDDLKFHLTGISSYPSYMHNLS